MKRILLTGAFEPEVDRLQFLHGRTIAYDSHLYTLHVEPVGIGNLNAALGLAGLLYTHREQKGRQGPNGFAAIVFLGSAGVYDRAIYDQQITRNPIAVSNAFQKREMPVCEQRAHGPAGLGGLIECSGHPLLDYIEQGLSSEEPQNAPLRGITGCPDFVTLEEPATLPDDFVGQAVLENMEGYGLALCAENENVPLLALFALTNPVGPDGSYIWKENYLRLSGDLQESVRTRLAPLLYE